MALTAMQERVLQVIARNRSPNSLFFGAAPLNRDSPRLSQDFDIANAPAEEVIKAFELDRAALEKQAFRVQAIYLTPTFVRASVMGSHPSEQTEIDWTLDSAYRFFPAVEEPRFGWRLHDIDLAVDKALALAGRREARDYFDIVGLHERGYPLAALAWAAPGKDPGFTPLLILDEMARNAVHSAEELLAAIASSEPYDPVRIKRVFLAAIAEARQIVPELPPEEIGIIYLDAGGKLALPRGGATGLHRHEPQRYGSWPRFPA